MTDQALIYLDYNATTPLDPDVLEAMMPYLTEHYGNASSRNHPFGWIAKEAVEKATRHIADLLQIDEGELLYTSGATESVNLAIKGVFEAYHRKGKHMVCVTTEHHAVLDPMEHLEKKGAEITWLEVDENGDIDLDALDAAIRSDTVLVCVMWANNETGVIHPMKAVGDLCEQKGVLLLSDATQVVGKIDCHPRSVGVHLMAFSGHKMYGPKGIGGLYISRSNPRISLSAQIHGGGHQMNMRSGTLNVPGIVGLGAAAKKAAEIMKSEEDRLLKLRNKLESNLASLEEVYVNGVNANRMSHVSNISFRFVESESLLSTVNQKIAASTGSACSSATLEPSHVLQAMGLDDDMAYSSIRFSLGRFTSEEDIDQTIEWMKSGVEQQRAISPAWELFQDGVLE